MSNLSRHIYQPLVESPPPLLLLKLAFDKLPLTGGVSINATADAP